MDVFEVITTRRSIRRYKDTPVEPDKLEKVLEAARWAPSWKNTQCWHFVIVDDRNIMAQLASTLPETNPARESFSQAPLVIVACARKGLAGYHKGDFGTDKGDWFMFDVALCMANLTLMAHALGLGTVHVGLFDAKEAGRILSVPAGFEVVEMTPLGYPDGEPKKTTRRELNEFVYKNKFGVAWR